MSFPHSGTYMPPGIAERMTDVAKTVPDTDWHVPKLYSFLEAMGASRLEATHSRYVTDLNRPPTTRNFTQDRRRRASYRSTPLQVSRSILKA